MVEATIVNYSEIARADSLAPEAWVLAKKMNNSWRVERLNKIARVTATRKSGEEGVKIDHYCIKYGVCPETTDSGIPVSKGDIVFSYRDNKFYLAPENGYIINGAKIEATNIDKKVLFGVLKTLSRIGIPKKLSPFSILVPIPPEEEHDKFKKMYDDEVEFNEKKRKLARKIEEVY